MQWVVYQTFRFAVKSNKISSGTTLQTQHLGGGVRHSALISLPSFCRRDAVHEIVDVDEPVPRIPLKIASFLRIRYAAAAAEFQDVALV